MSDELRKVQVKLINVRLSKELQEQLEDGKPHPVHARHLQDGLVVLEPVEGK